MAIPGNSPPIYSIICLFSSIYLKGKEAERLTEWPTIHQFVPEIPTTGKEPGTRDKAPTAPGITS